MYKVVYWEDATRDRLDVNATNEHVRSDSLDRARSFAHEWRRSGRAADIYRIHQDRSVSLVEA